jgi:site-specific recombinase XerD
MAWLEIGSSGLWVIRWREDGKVLSHSTGTKTRSKAERQLSEHNKLNTAIQEGFLSTSQPIVTIDDANKNFLQHRYNLKPRSRNKYRCCMDLFTKFCVSKNYKFLDDLKPNIRSEFMAFLEEGGYSANYINACVDCAKTFLSYCVSENLIQTSPMKRGTRAFNTSTNPLYFNLIELKALKPYLVRDARFNTWFRDYFFGYIYTGARRDELYQIQPEHVHLDTDQIELINSKVAHKKKHRHEQYRTIDINPKLRPILEQRMLHYMQNCVQKNGSPLFSPKEKAFNKTLRLLCDVTGIPQRACHACRHTFAYLCLSQQGCRLLELQALMGHQSYETTLIYSHLEKKTTGRIVRGIKF